MEFMNNEEYDISSLTTEFHTNGFVVVRNAFKDINFNEKKDNSIEIINKIYEKSCENFDECINIIKTKNLDFNVGTKFGFKEIVERHLHRYEMPYKMRDNELIETFCKGNPLIQALVTSILGANAACINQSLIMCMPGAEVRISWNLSTFILDSYTNLM